MQTRSLKTLLEISQVGSFVVAAQQLNMTLSAVSSQMKSLEMELGVALFDRAFRPPKLTPVGLVVCRYADKLLEIETTLFEACRPSDQLAGVYRIGFVATASVRLLPGFLNSSRARTPNVHFDIETGLSEVLEARVVSGKLDAAVVTATHNVDKRIEYRVLRREKMAYVAPNVYADLTPEMLFTQLPFFHFLPHSGIGKLIADFVDFPNRRDHKTIVLDNIEAIMECVNSGIGFTLLPEPDIQRHINDQAQIIRSQTPALSRQLVLATAVKSSMKVQLDQIESLFA